MNKLLLSLIVSISTIGLIACGGGGGGSSSAGAGSGTTVSGVASQGAPLSFASISILSLSNGAIYTPSTKTDASGAFSVDLDPTQYPAPYLIRITGKMDSRLTSQYAYASSSNLSGLVVSPFNSAAIALATGFNPDDVFARNIPIDAAQFASKVNILFKMTQDALAAQGVTTSAQLVNNTSYQANGTGVDGVLDLLGMNYLNAPGASNSGVLVASRFSGIAIPLNSSTTASNVAQLSVPANLAAKIIAGINANNQCLLSALKANSATQLGNCLDSSFNDGDITTAADYLNRINNGTPLPASFAMQSAGIEWCSFTDPTYTFASPSVANQSGVCFAKTAVTSSTEIGGSFPGFYKFVVNGSGNDLASPVKLYGNQISTSLDISTAIEKKTRIDGLTDNTGTTSGYRVEVGTGVENGVGVAKVLSAKVTLLNASGATIGSTVYLQCQQGASCTNSLLSVCTNSTCSAFDQTSSSMIGASSSLAQDIIAALKVGPVRAKVEASSSLMSAWNPNMFTTYVPINSIPLPQSDLAAITFPSISSASIAALKAWNGSAALTLDYSSGSASLFQGYFYSPTTPPSASEAFLNSSSGSVTVPNFGRSAVSISSCPPNSGVSYRSYTLGGVYNGIPMWTKYFGSCYGGDY